MSFFWNALLVLNSFLVLLNMHILSCTYIYEAVKFFFYLVLVFSFFQISIRYRAKNYGQIKLKKYNIYKKYLKNKKYKNGTHLTTHLTVRRLMRLYPASLTAPGACFSKVPIIIKRARKAVDVYK